MTPVARRAAVTAARDAHGISERRACSILGADRSAIRYRHRRSDDAAPRRRLKELAAERRRFGWRRLKLLLEREGIRMNHKKLRRLYAEKRLQVHRRGGRKRALGTRAPMTLPQGPNQRWSLDFASDTLTDGRRFRILVVVDDFTRECLCLVADTSLSGARVARELTSLIARRGARPLLCVSDNGTELTSTAILSWNPPPSADRRCRRSGAMSAPDASRRPITYRRVARDGVGRNCGRHWRHVARPRNLLAGKGPPLCPPQPRRPTGVGRWGWRSRCCGQSDRADRAREIRRTAYQAHCPCC